MAIRLKLPVLMAVLAGAAIPQVAGLPPVNITDLCPFVTTAGSPATVVAIHGTGMDYPNLRVTWQSGNISRDLVVRDFFSNAAVQTLDVTIPADLLTTAGSAVIVVTNTRQPPGITSFVATPANVLSGATVTLACVAHDAERLLISGPGVGQNGSVDTTDTSLGALVHPTAPNTTITQTFVCTASSTGFPSASVARTVTVNAPLGLACPANTATVGSPYADSFTARGGTPPYRFAITGGSLPAGLILTPTNGIISGTPTFPLVSPSVNNSPPQTIFNFTGTVTDSAGTPLSQSQSCTITLRPPPGPNALPQPPAKPTAPQTVTAVRPRDGNSANFLIVAPPTLKAVTPAATVTNTPLNLVVTGSGFVGQLSACTAGSAVTWDGATVISSPVSDSQLTASIPPALVTLGTHQVRVVNPGGIASNPGNVIVGNPLSITTASLPDGIVGQAYPSTRVLSVGGGSSLAWSLLPDIGLSIDPSTGVIQGTPAVAGANDLTVTVQDTVSTLSAARTYSIRILPPVSVSLSGLSVSIDPRQSQTLLITMPQPYIADVRAHLGLQFTPESGVAGGPQVRDPALQLIPNPPFFLDGDLLVPAGQTTVRVPMQTGTVAGTITAALDGVTVNGATLSLPPAQASTKMPSGPPVIDACIAESAPGILRIRVVGISSTREVQSAAFHFTPRAGRKLPVTDITASGLSDALFAPYYATQFGDFDYEQVFRIDGASDAIQSVTVSLTNSRGASPPHPVAPDCRQLP